jgi:outer membrane receptor protein involved in Fe transport
MKMAVTHFVQRCVSGVKHLLRMAQNLHSNSPAITVVLCCAIGATAVTGAEARKKVYNVPGGDAATTLGLFARTSDDQIVYMVENVRGEKTRPVRGEFTALDALRQMLTGTALFAVQDEATGALVVSRRRPGPLKKEEVNSEQSRGPPAGSPAPPPDPPNTNQPKHTESPSVKNRNFLALIAAWLVAGSAVADAQTASTPPKDEAVMLSPFTVSTDRDYGYLATNTLAGTRLNSELKDIGSQMSIFTADFLKDIGATNVLEAADYAMGTQRDFFEDGNESTGNYGTKGGTSSFRVRGLTGVGRARNFFPWVGPDIDVSTADRIEFSRGPNSILFGLGSPSGIFNVSTKRADLSRSFSTVDFRTSNFEQRRVSADVNRTSENKRFAVRVVPLYDHTHTWRDQEFRNRDGVYGALTFAPNRKTVLRADFERTNVSELTGAPFTAFDASSFWERAGRPIVQASEFTLRTNPVSGVTSAVPTVAIASRGNPVTTGIAEYSRRHLVSTGQYVFIYDASGKLGADWSLMPVGAGPSYSSSTQSYVYEPNNQVSTDPKYALNRLPRNTQLYGPAMPFTQKVNSVSASWEQEILRNLNAEVAFNHSTVSRENNSIAYQHNGLSPDASALLPDGRPNPNAGRYFVASEWTRGSTPLRAADLRATLSYRLDLTRKNPWLGRYTLAGLGERRETRDRSTFWREMLYKGAPVKGNAATDNQNRVIRRYYVDLEDSDTLRFGAPVDDPIDDQLDASRGVRVSSALVPYSVSARDGRLTTKMVVAQAFLVKDRIVGTFGQREDRLRQTNFRTELYTVGELTNVPRAVLDPSLVDFYRGKTETKGVVFHPFASLSLFYNQSTNFSINAGSARVFSADPAGKNMDQVAPNTVGRGKDFGIRLNGLLGGRAYLTLNHYENSGEKVMVGGRGDILNGHNRNLIFAIYAHNPTFLSGTGLVEAFDTVFNSSSNTVNTYSIDRVSKGDEVELTANLTPQWRLTAAYSRSRTMTSNVASELRNYIAKYDGFFNRPEFAGMRYVDYNLVAVLGSGTLGSSGMPAHDTTPVPAGQSNDYFASRGTSSGGIIGNKALANTVGEMWQANKDFYDEVIFLLRENARPLGEVPEQISLRTNYSFRRGWVNGISAGGGLRWRAGQVVGPLLTRADANGVQRTILPISARPTIRSDATFMADLNFGYERKIWRDRVKWEIQCNVSNLLNNTDAVPIAIFPDGRPRYYRWNEPRRIMLGSSFTF